MGVLYWVHGLQSYLQLVGLRTERRHARLALYYKSEPNCSEYNCS